MEGKGLFTFNVNCVVVVDCETGEGLFYSRRIGRSPQLADTYGDESSATATRILGAAKITGRLPGGFSLGVLDAVTDDVDGPGGTTLEPTTNYAVVRGNQDYDGGNGSLGFIATAVNRSLDASSEPYLHRSAYTRRLDARRRFGGRRFEVSGSFDLSRVAGRRRRSPGPSGTRCTSTSGPTARSSSTPTRTSLAGSNLELRFAKVGGNRLRFETAYQRRTPGFEINDIGFLRQADQQMWTTLGHAHVPQAQPGLPRAALELQQLGALEPRRAAHRARVQHQRAHPVQQPLVAARRAARSASSARPTATAAPGAVRRSGRTPTSRPGPASRATTASRWFRPSGSTTCSGDGGRSRDDLARARGRVQGVEPVHHRRSAPGGSGTGTTSSTTAPSPTPAAASTTPSPTWSSGR